MITGVSKMVIRAVAFIIGIVFILAVIGLGVATVNNQSPLMVALFGISAAIFAPLGIALIGYAFSSRDKAVLQRLSKVPEIESLVAKAQNQEEKIRLLEEQKQPLAEIIRLEARKMTLTVRHSELEQQGVKVLEELKAIEQEVASLHIDLEASTVTAEIQELRKRLEARQRGDFVFQIGRRTFILDANIVRGFPGGDSTLDTLKIVDATFKLITRSGRLYGP
jgi:hypothetical protein